MFIKKLIFALCGIFHLPALYFSLMGRFPSRERDMPEKIRLFARILMAELEDLADDIDTWGKYLDERHKEDKISEYVFLQNSATLKRELDDTRTILKDIAEDSTEGCADLDGARSHYLAIVAEAAARCEFRKAVTDLVTKKIEKAYSYVKA